MNHETAPAPAPTDSSTNQPADPSPSRSPRRLLRRNVTFYTARKGYFAAQNLEFRWRTLHRRIEAYIAVQNLTLIWRRLLCRREPYIAARNLESPSRTLHRAREVDIAPRKLTLRHRTFLCAKEVDIAARKLTLRRRTLHRRKAAQAASVTPDSPSFAGPGPVNSGLPLYRLPQGGRFWTRRPNFRQTELAGSMLRRVGIFDARPGLSGCYGYRRSHCRRNVIASSRNIWFWTALRLTASWRISQERRMSALRRQVSRSG